MTPSNKSLPGAVRFPLAPASGESWYGYLHRVSAHNLYASPFEILNRSGLSADDPDGLFKSVGLLSEILRQPPEAVSKLIPRNLGGGRVAFADGVVGDGPLLKNRRRLAPIVLREKGVDLGAWALKGRPVCMTSWTILQAVCPNKECRIPLDWATTTLFTCLSCGSDFRRARNRYIKREHRKSLMICFADSEEAWRAAVSEYMTPELNSLSYEIARDLVRVLAVSLRVAPFDRELPSYYPRGLLDGALAIERPILVRSIANGELGGRIADKLLAELRKLTRDNEPLQVAIKSITGIKCFSNEDREMTVTDAAAKLKIPRSKLRELVRVGRIRAAPIMGGELRRHDQIIIDELDDLVGDRIPISHLAKMFKIKDRYIRALALSGSLEKLFGIAEEIYPEPQFRRSQAVPYLECLHDHILRHAPGEGRTLLAEVMARLPPGPKPWASILVAAAEGRLEGGLGSEAPEGLEAEKLTLSATLATRLISGDIAFERPPWPCDPAVCPAPEDAYAVSTTLVEAEEVLGLYPRDVQCLARLLFLDTGPWGVSWRSIYSSAGKIIGTRELAAKVQITPEDFGLAASQRGLERIAPSVGVWRRQDALNAFNLTDCRSLRF